ncbi:CocE/NonD family hydrolase [Paraburkholderia bonniea]|uniref:dienelactone hydrolase family protein n=1 Tax=Paraburkholderia bonniea TaxID=2152891 RepID=UPI002573D5B6|nr:CocE/NonD family hydrolase [Paraburkholderia bonniea]WJF90303.1 CocE/NonD family hydrolase [Paraburkholderia bonniea]WJF93618.1 CocE/NonD family hydrolase [Paraburkholderia bonniea]
MMFSQALTGCRVMCAAVLLAVPCAHAVAVVPAVVVSPTPTPTQPGPLARAEVPRLALNDDAWLPTASLNAQVIRIPTDAADVTDAADASGQITLEATLYKPDGPGPFPLMVFNHGKIAGNPRLQPRSEPLTFAREFVRRGYAVIAPDRRGFAHSGGEYQQDGCDVASNGLGQAADVAATVRFMAQQPYVDAQHIAVAGTSHGGLATIAYGELAAPGVRALLNFAGGLRQDACRHWQDNLVDAFGRYGAAARVPSLWLYGENDLVWPAELVTRMYVAFAGQGGPAAVRVDIGRYKNDAHRLAGDRDGVRLWWPPVEAFLAQAGMPTRVLYRVADPALPPPSGYARLDAVDAVPFLDDAGRAGYRNFLRQYPSRAFAVSDAGAWSWAEGGDDPMAVAVKNCEQQNAGACRLYAVNDAVVWNQDQDSRNSVVAAPADNKRGSGPVERHAFAGRE